MEKWLSCAILEWSFEYSPYLTLKRHLRFKMLVYRDPVKFEEHCEETHRCDYILKEIENLNNTKG